MEPEHPKLGHLIKEAAAPQRGDPEPQTRASDASAKSSAARPGSARAPLRDSGDPAHSARCDDHPMMRACRREPVPYTPIWLMRQAGRYMPEYRRVRERFSFLEMCGRPDVAAEVTVTAVRAA